MWVLALADAPAASAQTIPSPFTFIERKQEAGLATGYTSAETGRFGLGPSGGLLLGGRYAVELSGPLSLEGHVGVISGTRDIVKDRAARNALNVLRLHLLRFGDWARDAGQAP